MQRTSQSKYLFLLLIAFVAPAFAQEFTPLRINAGGDTYTDTAGNVWEADRDFGPSGTFGTGATVSGTDDSALFQTLRYSGPPALSYSFAVPNGTYQVRALFAELWGGAFAVGARTFDVAAEGQTYFYDVDVFAEVGPNAALSKTFTVTVTDGTLNLDFVPKIQNPIVNAIEVTAATAPSAPTQLASTSSSTSQIELGWTASTDDVGVAVYEVERCQGVSCSDFTQVGTSSQPSFVDGAVEMATCYRYRVRAVDSEGQFSPYSLAANACTTSGDGNTLRLRVEAGGDAYVDASGATWDADYGFNGGSSVTVPQSVAGTDDPLLYRSLRWNGSREAPLEYAFAVPSGKYEINLHFAEIYAAAGYVGGRVFGVEVEGLVVIPELDVFAEVGMNTALVRKVQAVVTDGQLNIRFLHGRAENPFISAIEVAAIADDTEDPPPPPPPPSGDTTPPGGIGDVSATAVSAAQIDLVWTGAVDDTGVTGYSIERCAGSGCNAFVERATLDGLYFSDTAAAPATTYAYRIRARDAAGNFGAYSPTVTATTYDGVPVDPPPPPPPPVDEPPPPPPPPVDEPPPPPPPPVDDPPPPPVDDPPPPPTDDPPVEP